MQHVIQTHGLTKSFGRIGAVKDLDLAIPAGTVSAFLGPNGAGKTTTIRLLLGLLKAQAGTCEVLGHPPGHPEGLAQIGALVEMPSLYDHLTGVENARITQLMRGLPRTEVDRVLGLVGMAGDARRCVQAYSLGMRQRLGLALALMGDPRLLILDEPTNGMDPAGIQEMRELVRGLPGRTGATVFLSSHLLAEVEQVAQHLVVIHRGTLRYQGELHGLRTGSGNQIRARVDDPQGAVARLAARGLAAEEGPGGVLLVKGDPALAPRVAAMLVECGIGLHELHPENANLESRFLALLEEA